MDAKFIQPFVEGTQKTLHMQCHLEAKPMKPFIKGGAAQPAEKQVVDIAGIIGLSAPTFTGTIALCFPKAAFLKIMSNMLGEAYTEITDDLTDGAAELLNIVFGHAKTVLNGQGHKLDKAIPTVVRGRDIQTRQITKSAIVVLPFDIGGSVFYIEITEEK